MSTNKKIVSKMRGTGVQYMGGEFEFTPEGEGKPTYESVQKFGSSSLCRTSGEKKKSVIAKLKVDEDSQDLATDLQRELDKILETLPKTSTRPKPRSRILSKSDALIVALNEKEGTLQTLMTIDLKESVDYMKEFYKLVNSTSRCLDINETSVKQCVRALLNSSTK